MNRAVFLDRDGTVTKSTGLITHADQIDLENGAADGIKLLNRLGLKIVIVTNQPQIARGMATEEQVNEINDEVVKMLEEKGAKVDAVYFCPHHPERHHKDVPPHALKYRIDCECRKPGTGMLKDAAKQLDIDVPSSFIVGDRTVDIQTGKNAGCKSILVSTGEAGRDKKHDVRADWECNNLLDAAKLIERNISTKAVILAGGRGERLMPLTDKIPKPMIDIAGKPVLQHQIESLKKGGITEIILCGSYMVDKIKEYFGNGEKLGVNIYYPQEPEPLGSGGAIRNASNYIKPASNFFVVNGDIMMGREFDFSSVLDYHIGKKSFATLVVRESDHPKDSDVLKLDKSSKVTEFVGRGQESDRTANVGIMVFAPAMIDFVPKGKSNIEKDVVFRIIDKKDVYGFMLPKGWFTKDMGTPERLESVRQHFNSQT